MAHQLTESQKTILTELKNAGAQTFDDGRTARSALVLEREGFVKATRPKRSVDDSKTYKFSLTPDGRKRAKQIA